MGKLAPAIACCLLFAVPAAGCAQHPGDSSGVTDSVSEQQLHEQVDRQVAAAAADMYGWNPADTVAEPLAGTGGDACRLLGVRSPSALPSINRTWAVVHGEVVAPGTAGALEQVLGACDADASADVWAEAVAAFGTDVPPGYVVRREQEISSLAHRRAREAGGYAFHPPRFSRDEAGAREVEFFMTDVEGAGLYQVRAAREGDGPVRVMAEPAGGL